MPTLAPEITPTVCPPFEIQMPHLGLGYLAANLERGGAVVRIYDLNLELYERVDEAQRQHWETAGSGGWWMDDRFLERFFSACRAAHRGFDPDPFASKYRTRFEQCKERRETELGEHVPRELPHFRRVERRVSRQLRRAGLL